VSWLGRVDATPTLPAWGQVGTLTSAQTRCLLAEISYDRSQWNYGLVGADNQLGRYQFTATVLEEYGLLAATSVESYGSDAVNYLHCWTPSMIRSRVNSYANYMYNTISLQNFLTSYIAQEHLAYQLVSDLYTSAKKSGAIIDTDTPDIVAGMIYVAWVLGIDNKISVTDSGQTALTWRNSGLGTSGAQAFNTGRYAITVLSL
jgi:hypothetical protein